MTYIIVVILILFSSLFSGLTLGLMSLSTAELKRKKDLGDKEASKIYPVRKHGNLLLTTLLIGNVGVNATLSIFLGTLTSGVVAGIIATIIIVIFGEIIPQATFSRYSLFLGAKTAWIIRIIIFLLYPICVPVAYALDKILGKELPTIYSKQELVKIIEEHEDSDDSDVKEDEEKIVKGALTFSDKLIKNVLTPRGIIVAFDASTVITEELLDEIREKSRTRMPVYDGDLDNITGLLYMQTLMGGSCVGKTVGEVADDKVLFIKEEAKLGKALNAFIKTQNHLFVVRDEFGSVAGVVTLEDILEEIIQTEILDEDDTYHDLREYARTKFEKEQNGKK